MLPGIFFFVFRLLELTFLIPPLGMLSAIVHNYVSHNQLAPAFVLVLFIVVVIASVWTLLTMLLYGLTKKNGYLVALVDLLIFGGLIGGVVVLGPVAGLSCSSPNLQSPIYLESAYNVYDFGNFCNLLKASFGLAVIEIILFFFTIVSGDDYSVLALTLKDSNELLVHIIMGTSPPQER